MQERWEANIRGMDVELIEYAVKLIVCIIEIYIFYDFFHNFSNVRIVLNQKCVFCICLCSTIILFGMNLEENGNLNLIGFPILLWCFIVIIFEMNIWMRILYFIIAYSLIMGCEFLYLILSKLSVYVIAEEGVSPLSDNIWQLIAIKLLTFIMFVIAKQISSKNRKHMAGNVFIMYLCLPVATLCMMLIIFYSGVDFESNTIQKILMTIFMLLMLVGNILIFNAFNKYAEKVYENSYREIIIRKQNDELIHLRELFRKNEKHQELIHDTSNYLKTIGKLLTLGENTQAKDVLSELNSELEKNVMMHYSNNTIFNALLSEKAMCAESHNIDFDVFVEPNVRLDIIKEIDLISMVGNLIDNAIRGAEECDISKKVQVKVFMQNAGNVLVIKIINDCSGKIKIHNEELVSTKNEKGLHGLGIKSVNHTVTKYDGYLEYFHENKKFTAILIFPI